MDDTLTINLSIDEVKTLLVATGDALAAYADAKHTTRFMAVAEAVGEKYTDLLRVDKSIRDQTGML